MWNQRQGKREWQSSALRYVILSIYLPSRVLLCAYHSIQSYQPVFGNISQPLTSCYISILPFPFHLFYYTCVCLLFISSVLSYKVIVIYLSLEFLVLSEAAGIRIISSAVESISLTKVLQNSSFVLHRIRVYISAASRKSSLAQFGILPLQHRLDSVDV